MKKILKMRDKIRIAVTAVAAAVILVIILTALVMEINQ